MARLTGRVKPGSPGGSPQTGAQQSTARRGVGAVRVGIGIRRVPGLFVPLCYTLLLKMTCLYCYQHSLAYDLCSSLAVEKSILLQCFHKVADSFQHLTAFLFSKIVSRPDWITSGVANNDITKSVSALLRTSAEQ